MSTDQFDSNSTPSPEEIKACVAYLQQGLLDSECPAAPSERRRIVLCPVCVRVHVEVVIRATYFAIKDFPKQELLVGCHRFLLDVMWLLTNLPATDDERKMWPDVRHVYDACHDHTDRADYSDEKLMSHVLSGMKAVLSICLGISVGTHCWSTRFGTKGAWPTCIPDILPGNPPRLAMSNLLRYWSRHVTDQVSTAILSAVIFRVPSIHGDIAAALMDTRDAFLPAYSERATAIGRELQHLPVGSFRFGYARKELDEYFGLSFAVMQPLIMAKILPHQFIVGHESQLNAAFDEVFRGEKRLAEPLSVSINSIRMQWFGNRHTVEPLIIDNSRHLISGGLSRALVALNH